MNGNPSSFQIDENLMVVSNGNLSYVTMEKSSLTTIGRGDLVIVAVDKDQNGKINLMLGRTTEFQESKKTITIIPYDSAWPREENDPASFENPSFRFFLKLPSSRLVTEKQILEEALFPLCSKKNGLNDGQQSSVFDLINKMAQITLHDYEQLLEIDNQQKNDKQTSSLFDVSRFRCIGAAKGPAGFLDCSNCASRDARRVCARFFECKTGICLDCYRSSSELNSKCETWWFCRNCTAAATSPTPASIQPLKKVRLIEQNDGYDNALAWSFKSINYKITVFDAVSMLNRLRDECPRNVYQALVVPLMSWLEDKMSRDELIEAMDELRRSNQSQPLLDVIKTFLPHSAREKLLFI